MAIRPAQAPRRLSLQQFLAMPETKPASELIDGEVVQKPVPRMKHNRPIRNLIRILERDPFALQGDWVTEQGISFPNNHRVPDFVWFAPGRVTDVDNYPEFAPDLAVEVISDGQSRQSQQERLAFLRAHGTPTTLLIDPVREAVEVHDGARSFTASGTDEVRLDSMSGLTFIASALFSR